MSCEIIVSKGFVRELKPLAKRYRSIKNDLAQLGKELKTNPQMGIDLGSGIRKIRLAISSKGKGKSGGVRVITYNVIAHVEDDIVVLVSIYDKSKQDSIAKRDIMSRLKKEGFLQ